jgi:uncharacterized protein (UPF0128 family)
VAHVVLRQALASVGLILEGALSLSGQPAPLSLHEWRQTGRAEIRTARRLRRAFQAGGNRLSLNP